MVLARTEIRVVSAIAAALLMAAVAILVLRSEGQHMQVQDSAVPAISEDDLAAAAQARVFFGHQSVGMNVLDGILGVYAGRESTAPAVVELAGSADEGAGVSRSDEVGYFAHAYLGQNGDPVGKIADFDARIRAGLGDEIDVAMMKFCYVDVTSATDVESLFRQYRATMAALERDFPAVTFLHVTTPLTTEPSLASKVRALLGRNEHVGPADNVAREQLNAMLRQEYGAGRLFDLASIESTAPDGTRTAGRHQGADYFALYPGYAADAGHLNTRGSEIAAAHLLSLVARSSGQ